MTPYRDIADLSEDDRIQMIGEKTMKAGKVVGFFVDDDSLEPGKADRYIQKLQERFPGIRVTHRGPGLVAGTTLIKVEPPLH